MTGRSVAQRRASQRCSPDNEFEDAEVLIHKDPQGMESVPEFLAVLACPPLTRSTHPFCFDAQIASRCRMVTCETCSSGKG